MISSRRHEHLAEPTGHGACWGQIHARLAEQDAADNARLNAYLAREREAKAAGQRIRREADPEIDRSAPTAHRRRLSPEQRARCRQMHREGVTIKDIARYFGVGWDAAKAAVREG